MKVYNPFVGWVEFRDNPSRIVSLNPSITETIFELGAGQRVVGVSSWCHRPKDALSRPKVGSYTLVLVERLRQLDPELIFTTTGAQKEALLKLLELGYPTYPIPYPRDLYAILSTFADVGGLIGENVRALKLCRSAVELIARLSSRWRENRVAVRVPRVYVEIDLGGPTIPAYFNHITHAFHLAGIENVLLHRSVDYLYGMPVNGYEVFDVVAELRKIDPDVIVFESKSFHPNQHEGLEVMESRGLSDLKAVRSGKVLTLPADTLAHYGPTFLREVLSVCENIWEVYLRE
ncbi:MAG: ABC transporter substrate-binding protein [Thaumarchaeota archaeon]|nr:ABC transporter substrate-binding protein [Candidatus Calditenuaceae archaeon]MDW8186990.1 ABC transporter substrate-binding protein [Nitrososphaerota archaeon]